MVDMILQLEVLWSLDNDHESLQVHKLNMINARLLFHATHDFRTHGLPAMNQPLKLLDSVLEQNTAKLPLLV
jgi:hypothetical protein